VDQIADTKSREGVIKIWLELAAKTARERFEDIPKNLNLEKHETLDGHIQGVTRISLTLSDITKYIHGLSVDRDLLIADCLLHEILKPMKSEPNPGGPATESSTPPAKKRSSAQRFSTVFTAPTRAGKNLPKTMELAHLLITHTRTSNTRAVSYEASLLFYADWAESADSDAGIITGGGKPSAPR
jgi:hypothetical protein